MTTLKLVYLEWVDSVSVGGSAWTCKEEVAETDPYKLIIQTVGFIVKETKLFITVASSIGEFQLGGNISIPKVAILKRKVIKN